MPVSSRGKAPFVKLLGTPSRVTVHDSSGRSIDFELPAPTHAFCWKGDLVICQMQDGSLKKCWGSMRSSGFSPSEGSAWS
jgi:hypothetical protein